MSKAGEGLKVIEGQLQAQGLRFGVVASRFNSSITEKLTDGAIDALVRHGASKSNITLVHVPGGFEIALAARSLAKTGNIDAIVAIGAVIRGATSHYDLVCRETARGISHVALETGVPVTFGVITTDTIEQAVERSGTKAGNKGAEAAMAAIEMANVLRAIEV